MKRTTGCGPFPAGRRTSINWFASCPYGRRRSGSGGFLLRIDSLCTAEKYRTSGVAGETAKIEHWQRIRILQPMLDLQCKRPRYFTWPPELVEAELELDELEDEPELPELCD